ncbi:MAG: galactitol-1-phosphate 5-dehydrogenase [Candidatus Cyclobacteriaceae bacterium M3_2C_046]
MKALVLEAYKKFDFKEVSQPQPSPREVLVRTKAVGICGSDVHGMDGSTGRRQPPIIMGHEASGIIEEVGEEVNDWKPGDRVTFDSTIYELDDWYTLQGMYNLSDNRKVLGVSCDDYRRHGAFAEYVVVPQHILYQIPENVSFEQAAMVEPVAVAAHAVGLSPLVLNDTAVVVGAGMIGLFLVQVLKVAGCGKVIAVDLDQQKMDLARKMGADHVFNPDWQDVPREIKDITNGRGADLAFEAVGITSTVKMAIDSVRKGATVTLVGNLSPQVELPLQSVVTRQIRLQGSCAIAGEYPAVLDMISRQQVDVDTIISAIAPLSEGASWFSRLYQKEPGLMKVVLQP